MGRSPWFDFGLATGVDRCKIGAFNFVWMLLIDRSGWGGLGPIMLCYSFF